MGAKKKPKDKSEGRRTGSVPELPDRRAAEKVVAGIGRLLREREFGSVEEANAFLQQVVAGGEVPEAAGRTALERAQGVMYQAWGTSGKRRVELARKALQISPDCGDASVLLAEETARSVREAKELYEKGVEAGERALAQEHFREEAGRWYSLYAAELAAC